LSLLKSKLVAFRTPVILRFVLFLQKVVYKILNAGKHLSKYPRLQPVKDPCDASHLVERP